ncbi:MAG: tetratricopeptide repeat protein [Candidatus Binatia bacterium]
MRQMILSIAVILAAACAPRAEYDIETDFNQRIETGGLSGDELARAYIDRGILRLAAKETGAALADFNLAIATAPNLADGYVWRGVATDTSGDPVRAKEDYDRAVAVDPNSWLAHGARGLLMARNQEDDLALRELDLALDLGKAHEGEYLVRELKTRKIMRQNRIGPPATGTSTQKLVISVNEQLANYRVIRSLIFMKKNDQEMALLESGEAVRLAPTSMLAQMNRAKILLMLGRCDEAKTQFEDMAKQTGISFKPKVWIKFAGMPPDQNKCPELAE